MGGGGRAGQLQETVNRRWTVTGPPGQAGELHMALQDLGAAYAKALRSGQ